MSNIDESGLVRCESIDTRRYVYLQTDAIAFHYRWIIERFSSVFGQQQRQNAPSGSGEHQQRNHDNVDEDDDDDGEDEREGDEEDGDKYIDDRPASCQRPHVDSPLFAADVSRGISWFLRLVAATSQRGQRYYSLYLHLDRSSSWSDAMAVLAANVGQSFPDMCNCTSILYYPGKYSRDDSVKYEPYCIRNFINELWIRDETPFDRLVISAAIVQLPMATYAPFVSVQPSYGLPGNFTELLRQEKLVDVTFKTDDGRCFPAHRCVVAARSPVFRAMFDNRWTEANKPTIAVPDVDAEVFAEVLAFIYSDVAPPSLSVKPLELLVAADRFGLSRLMTMAENQLIEQLSNDNVCDVLITADQHSRPYLKQSALIYLTQNAEAVSHTEGWNRLHNVRNLLDEVILEACRQVDDDEGLPLAKRVKTS